MLRTDLTHTDYFFLANSATIEAGILCFWWLVVAIMFVIRLISTDRAKGNLHISSLILRLCLAAAYILFYWWLARQFMVELVIHMPPLRYLLLELFLYLVAAMEILLAYGQLAGPGWWKDFKIKFVPLEEWNRDR